MAKVTPTEYASKWARNLSAAASDVVAGAEKVTEAPGKKAAANKDVWASKLASPEVQAKWAANVGAVSLEEWKAKMRELVPARLPSGVAAASSEMEKFGSQLLAYQEANVGKVRAIKKVTLADGKRRMDEWFDIMSKFRYKK